MKKLIMLLFCGGLLVACSQSSYQVKVSDGNQTIVSGSDITITKQDYFEALLDQSGPSTVLAKSLTTIADKELGEDNDSEELQKIIEEKKKTYAGTSGSLKETAEMYGFDSEEEYINEAIIPDAKQELLRNNYIKENLDDFMTNYQVARFKKIVVDKESTALTLIEEATSQDAFDKLMEENKDNAEDVDIVTKNSTLDDNLKAKLEEFSTIKEDGVYKEAIKLSDDSFAVIYLYDTAREDTQEYIDVLTSINDIQTEIEGIYLKKYHFTVNDKNIKERIKELSSQYIE